MSSSMLPMIVAYVVFAIMVLAAVRERLWSIGGAPADLGPIDFATLGPARRGSRFLAAPAGFTTAVPDLEPPRFRAFGKALALAFAAAAETLPHGTRVSVDGDGLGARYVFRTPFSRRPDTVQIRILPLEGDETTVAILSHSRFSLGGTAAHAARVKALIAGAEAHLARTA
ncbi:Protein of unknown function [Pseudoxanthobacter soli DSM 19599]|uniref:DUF1499 domain-containing protein n=1 Tax=Pseudoxanthobacter soli DSM 19599 TaxID=1123029 RepID=A0A1M7ZIB5_9HYPH|nr:DUF1499 domain-containing protein [Pseudoxanthobacter soli]SHO64614.1 Protein of unknown function [Pseudoxanthobacter soli DSM 19599]